MFSPLLAKLRNYVALDEADIAALAHLDAHFVCRAAGTLLVDEGDSPDHAFIILSGWGLRFKILRDGSRQILAYLLPGDISDPQFSLGHRIGHSVSVVTDAVVAKVRREALLKIINARPAIGAAFDWAAIVDSSISRSWLTGLGRRSAFSRAAHLFCELHDRAEQIGLTADDVLTMPLTQTDLADSLGITCVHTNRVLQQMRHEGLITLSSKKLSIIDLPAMKRIADYNVGYLQSLH